MESTRETQENKNAVQDRKSMWKHLKQQRKEAKKSKREEEFLANLRKPKDTKVVLADKSFVEKLRNQNVPSPAKRAPGFLAQDFPALSAKVSYPKRPPKSKEPISLTKVVDNSEANCTLMSVPETKENRVKKENNCGDLSSTTVTVVTVSDIPPEPAGDAEQINRILTDPPKPKKRTKRKDPVILDSHDFISAFQKKSLKKDMKSLDRRSKYRRKPEVGILCGNMLDSSNPIRKRGKHREIKKIKLSKLKFAIITDRILKQKERNDSNGKDLIDRKQLKTEIDDYLSNLTKTKLELADKRLKRSEENKTEEVISEEIIPTESRGKKVKKKHPKYRKYCDNGYSEGLDVSVRDLITGIVYAQDRAFSKDAIKARAKQRHVVGLREVKKYLVLKKIEMVVVAPDLEAKDAVDSVVEDLKKTASLQNVPCVFALSRRTLGCAAKKAVPVSAFGIISYDGLEEKFVLVKENLKEAQDKYKLVNCEIGKTGNSSLEVTAADIKSEDVQRNKAASEGSKNEHVPRKNKKKTKPVQKHDEAQTEIVLNERLIDTKDDVQCVHL